MLARRDDRPRGAATRILATMDRDLRGSPLYQDIEAYFRRLREPAFGRISGAADPAPSPDGRWIAFTGTRIDRLEGSGTTRIGLVGMESGDVREITGGPNSDRSPRWSPDGRHLAFLSDRRTEGEFQLHLLDAETVGEAHPAPPVDGSVEHHAWSPDGDRILLVAAGRGADRAGAEGSGTTNADVDGVPSWTPTIEGGDDTGDWRRLHVFDLADAETRVASREGLNVWEAVWCGGDHALAVVSDTPDENAWYGARLALIDLAIGSEQTLYRTGRRDRQIGLPVSSPSGHRVAALQAVCSDRAIIAGDIVLIDPSSGDTSTVEPGGVDVTHLAWRDEDRLFFMGIRGLDTVAGEVDAETRASTELWSSDETCGDWYPTGAPTAGDAFVIVLESYERPQELAVIREGKPETIASFAHDGTASLTERAGRLERVSWEVPDGLEIHGLLAVPAAPGPYALVVNVHGGPVSAYRSQWLMRSGTVPLLVSRGYAVLMPNPRGSTGRGQQFAEMVVGDMGGADAQDILAGIDAMVDRGIADPARIGVTGGSYGGFMSAWLVTQVPDRFAASVTVSPVTDWYSQHWTSNIGAWDADFLRADPACPGGAYFERSPVMSAGQTRTPTLVTAGLNDRCTPPGQAIEFYQALRAAGVEAALALYPEEGHGVRRMPAMFDYFARMVGWFDRFMPARSSKGDGETDR